MHCSQLCHLCMPSRYSLPSNGPSLPPSFPSPPQRTEVTSYLCHTIIESIYDRKLIIVPLGLDHVKGQCAPMGWYPSCESLPDSKEDANSKILYSVLQHFISKEAFEHSKIQNSLCNSILWNLNTVSSNLIFRKTWNEVAGFWVSRFNNRAGRKGAVCIHVLSLTVLGACQSRVVFVKLGIQKVTSIKNLTADSCVCGVCAVSDKQLTKNP